MSGPICPDCGSFAIERRVWRDRCDLCGWSGPILPRKILFNSDLRRHAADNREMVVRREAGELFFLRVWIDERFEDDLTEALMDLLDADSMDGADPYFFIESSVRPSRATLKQIRRMKGVKRVRVT